MYVSMYITLSVKEHNFIKFYELHFLMQIQDSYDSMFGALKAPEEIHIVNKGVKQIHILPKYLPMSMNEQLIKEVLEKAKKDRRWVLAFFIGTKPCFYKFFGSVMEAEKANLPYLVIDANQHYDPVLTHGLTEFNYLNKVAANLEIRGDLAQKSAELMIKVSWLARYLKKEAPEVTVVPVVLGDTILTSMVPAAWMFSRDEKAIQNEAGLRSMAPEIMKEVFKTTPERFIDQQFQGKWMLLRNEPFPEQWDTYTSAAGSEFLFAPVDLNRQHLIREGYPEQQIFTIGGVVVDALEVKRKEKREQSIFSLYPQLEKGEWIRVDIHRRDNLTERRFKSIISGIKLMVNKGYNVNFIEMNATKHALQHFQLRHEIDALKEKSNFLHTEVWPKFSHVMEFYESKHCFAAFTDSGGVQEEMNLLKKPCLTCRFNTDRPETVNDAHGNLLVPPVSGEFILQMVEYVQKHPSLQKDMQRAKQIYGQGVGKKFINQVKKIMDSGERPFKWSHEALGLWKEDSNTGGY